MSNKKFKLYSCFLDLKRAAIFFYKNPKGNTHKVFLNNALEILSEIKNKNIEKYKKEILQHKINTSKNNLSDQEKMRIADDILTTGILLKS